MILVYNRDLNNVSNVVLGDPYGWGREVKIPGILISKEDGQKIQKFFEENTNTHDINNVQVEIDFRQVETETVTYEIFFTNGYDKVYQMMRDLREMHEVMGDKVIFEPKYMTHKNIHYNKGKDECIVSGKYCTFDNEWYFPITGRSVVIHNIKEKCIWKTFKNNKKFFDYIDDYAKCASFENLPNKEDCVDRSLAKSDISLQDVNNCYSSNIKVQSK
jgi:hypothetical protein